MSGCPWAVRVRPSHPDARETTYRVQVVRGRRPARAPFCGTISALRRTCPVLPLRRARDDVRSSRRTRVQSSGLRRERAPRGPSPRRELGEVVRGRGQNEPEDNLDVRLGINARTSRSQALGPERSGTLDGRLSQGLPKHESLQR